MKVILIKAWTTFKIVLDKFLDGLAVIATIICLPYYGLFKILAYTIDKSEILLNILGRGSKFVLKKIFWGFCILTGVIATIKLVFALIGAFFKIISDIYTF